MSRPAKQGLDWLPVSTDIFTDTIAQGLRATFGTHALAVRMAVMLHIARSGYYATADQAFLFAIADAVPGQNAAYIADVIQFLVNNGEYDAAAYSTCATLTSCYLQESWLRCKKGRRITADAPFWLLPQSGIMEAKTPVSGAKTPVMESKTQMLKNISGAKTPVMESKTPVMEAKTPVSGAKSTRQYNKDILLSPIVDNNIQKVDDDNDQFSDSKFPDLDREIAALAADDPWVEHMAMQHHASLQDIKDTLHTFRDACIERGKTAHRSVDDTKQHFVNWLNRRQYSSNPQKSTDNGRINQRNSSRRSTITPGYGLARS